MYIKLVVYILWALYATVQTLTIYSLNNRAEYAKEKHFKET